MGGKFQGQQVKRGDRSIPHPAEVKTNGVRANIIGTCPANSEEFDENFRTKLPSKDTEDERRTA
jgi:hypothetical protein